MFRHFLDRLQDGSDSNPEHLLKDWLAYEAVNAEQTLDDFEWFNEGFPDSPLLAHSLAVYKALTKD